MIMKIFGYKNKVVNDVDLLEMKEISFQGKPDKHRAIAAFLQRSADLIEANPKGFDHDHISFNNPAWDDDYPEIVVVGCE